MTQSDLVDLSVRLQRELAEVTSLVEGPSARLTKTETITNLATVTNPGGPTQAIRVGHETLSHDHDDAQRGHNIVKEVESLIVRPEVLQEHSAHNPEGARAAKLNWGEPVPIFPEERWDHVLYVNRLQEVERALEIEVGLGLHYGCDQPA
jgi:hypothetical protein